jgi:hypothetical protein
MFCCSGKRGKFIPSWFWILIIGIPISILVRRFFWWFFIPSNERTSLEEVETPRAISIPVPAKKDDFRKIKGIGPKTSDTLQKAGILSFEQLGLMEPEKLEQILKRLSIPSAKAGFWQEQAKLAAAEDWEKLKNLQKKS